MINWTFVPKCWWHAVHCHKKSKKYFEKNDVKDKVRALLKYRRENPQEIDLISKWYSENFFIEPTEKNIIKAFELR